MQRLFSTHFGSAGTADAGAGDGTFGVRAPGRVNLIGEHVDYNDGFVLPIAISLETRLMVRPRADRNVELYSANFEERIRFSLDHMERQGNWMDYVQGVARELAGASVPLHGFEGVVSSDVPVASGLSSSAAIEVAAALTFTHLAQQPMAPTDLARICQKAENNFVGVNCGIMDQMAVAACHADHALLIDCRTLDHSQVPLRLSDHVLIVTDSGAPRELASSAYNERRAQCEQGLEILRQKLPHLSSLRDVTSEDLARYGDALPAIVLQRVRHVVEEIARTLLAVEHLRRDDFAAFGKYMRESHESLAKLYEVSSAELDWLVNWAMAQPGVLGSRLTGAGFGGCTVTLIKRQNAEDFIARLPDEYKQAMEREARCWICKAEEGAQVLDLD
ncbi:MAG TPA: galactokinase [Abditibacteriaceae bacterium]|nr:galactokinase [Abditibacteriaceae bacterium]